MPRAGKAVKDFCEGDFKDQIIIQQATLTPDTQGGQAAGWGTFISPWALILPWKGRERVFGGQLRASTTHRIYIRYEAGVTAKMRILFGARTFNIESLIDIEEAHEFWELWCEEGEGVAT